MTAPHSGPNRFTSDDFHSLAAFVDRQMRSGPPLVIADVPNRFGHVYSVLRCDGEEPPEVFRFVRFHKTGRYAVHNRTGAVTALGIDDALDIAFARAGLSLASSAPAEAPDPHEEAPA